MSSILGAPLAQTITPAKVGDLHYRSVGTGAEGNQAFGGETMGRAVLAAGAEFAPDSVLASARADFVAPGIVKADTDFHLELVREGRTYAVCRVTAVQDGRTILDGTATFQKRHDPDALSHQSLTLTGPGPEELDSIFDVVGDDARLRNWLVWFEQHPVEVRVEPDLMWSKDVIGTRPSRQKIWMRITEELPDSDLMHSAALIYLSDMFLIATVAGPHGLVPNGVDPQVSTLNHGLWQRQACRTTDWLLYDMDSQWSGAGRTLCPGSFYTQDGTLVATALQEGVVRRVL